MAALGPGQGRGCSNAWTVDRTSGDDLANGGAYRAWHVQGPEGVNGWWVEVTDRGQLSFVTVMEVGDRSYTGAQIKDLARGVLGEVNLARTVAQSTSTSATRAPGTTTTSTTRTTTPQPSTDASPPGETEAPSALLDAPTGQH